MAIVQGNKLGANNLYGYASPISAIKGIFDDEENSFDKAQMALIDIYSHLGYEFIKTGEEFKFIKTWKRGDIKDFENREINKFISNIVDNNNQKFEEQSK